MYDLISNLWLGMGVAITPMNIFLCLTGALVGTLIGVLPGMRGFAFGPGTAPRLFAFTLGILSLGVVVGGFLIAGPHVSSYKIRGVIFIIGSILAFAATIRPLGLVIASFCTMIICAAAAEDVKWRETLIVAIVVTTFCSILFPYGLNLPFQLWPRFW